MECQKNKACPKQPANALPDPRPLCTGCDKPGKDKVVKTKKEDVIEYAKEAIKHLDGLDKEYHVYESVQAHIRESKDLINKIVNKLEGHPPGWGEGFDAGVKAQRRRNKSGCCCLFSEDGETIEELCLAHAMYIEEKLAIRTENAKKQT